MKPIIAVPATAALVYRAWSRKSLTPAGIFFATLTAVAHAVHPWSVFFVLLCVFFLGGTTATKVKHNVKATLTQSSSGSSGGEGPRTHIQVLANSAVASVLILIHAYQLAYRPVNVWTSDSQCWWRQADAIIVGIVANYAAVTSDTFSSELGILSSSPPRLITAPWRTVPKGTNGGVTFAGLAAGLFGSFLIAVTAALFLPFCPAQGPPTFNFKLLRYGTVDAAGWPISSRIQFIIGITFMGFCGTILDSLLGALLQASVVDSHTGKVIEGDGGRKVLVHSAPSTRKHAELRSKVDFGDGKEAVASTSAVASGKDDTKKRAGDGTSEATPNQGSESRRIASGKDILDNNAVNFLMAATISWTAMTLTTYIWGLPKQVINAGFY